jgi:hypothetical protein
MAALLPDIAGASLLPDPGLVLAPDLEPLRLRIAGLCDRPKPGLMPKPSEGQMANLKAVVLAGPDPAADQVGRWRIVDLCRYVEGRWEVRYSETGMLRFLLSLDLSHRKTRPRHP